MATSNNSLKFEKLRSRLGESLWAKMLARDISDQAVLELWKLKKEYQAMAASLWMEDKNFKKVGSNPTSKVLSTLVMEYLNQTRLKK